MNTSQAKNAYFLVDVGSYLSIFAYFLTAIIKLYVANITHSAALYADGLNSASDVASTIVLLVGLKLARRPIDEDHRYGHYRIEHVASLIASLIMFLIGGQALLNGGKKFIAPDLSAPDMFAAYTALVCAAIILISAFVNYRIYKKVKMSAVNVIAKHNMSDALTAFGAFIAIAAAQFRLPLIDPIASVLIAIIILKTAFDIFFESSNSLIDGFDTGQLASYQASALTIPGVKDVLDIRGRMLGNMIVIDITIAVAGSLSVDEAHRIADILESHFEHKHNVQRVYVHIEPFIDQSF